MLKEMTGDRWHDVLIFSYRALANVQAHLGTTAAATTAPAADESDKGAMDVDTSALPNDVVEKINETSER